MRTVYSAVFAVALAWCAAAPAAEINLGKTDTIESVLRAQKGRVTVRTRSGLELTGTVRSVDSRLVHLGALQGKEFFDAVVAVDSIEAVLVRTKE